MAKETLLKITQDILMSLEDDEVNSISDTPSSMSVAQTVQSVFDEMVVNIDYPANNQLMQLESLSDVDRPNYMKMPDNLKKVHWIKYDNQDVTYKTPKEFVDYVINRDDGVDVEDFGGAVLKIQTNKNPTYWTTFDDEYIVFDSIDLDESSTLLSDKTLCWVAKIPYLELDDDAIPDIPESLFPTFKAKCKARCFVDFKQIANANAEQAVREGMVRHQNDMFRHNNRKPYNRTPNYGKPRR